MSIKKAYVELVEFLNANSDKKVKSILPEIQEMCSAKGAGGSATTFHKDENGNVTHIRCGYYGQWMPLSHVKFGAKAGSASGYNSMCQEGTNNYSKQNREFKAAKEELLQKVADGEVTPEQIGAELKKLEEARTAVIPRRDGIGFDSLEDALNADPAELDAMQDAVLAEEANKESAE